MEKLLLDLHTVQMEPKAAWMGQLNDNFVCMIWLSGQF